MKPCVYSGAHGVVLIPPMTSFIQKRQSFGELYVGRRNPLCIVRMHNNNNNKLYYQHKR